MFFAQNLPSHSSLLSISNENVNDDDIDDASLCHLHFWRHDIQYNDIQYNDIQYNNIQCNNIQL